MAAWHFSDISSEIDKLGDKALAIKPDYAEAYSNMGNALQEQGKLEEAIEAFNKALAIKPDYAEVCWNLSGTAENISETKNWDEQCIV